MPFVEHFELPLFLKGAIQLILPRICADNINSAVRLHGQYTSFDRLP